MQMLRKDIFILLKLVNHKKWCYYSNNNNNACVEKIVKENKCDTMIIITDVKLKSKNRKQFTFNSDSN